MHEKYDVTKGKRRIKAVTIPHSTLKYVKIKK